MFLLLPLLRLLLLSLPKDRCLVCAATASNEPAAGRSVSQCFKLGFACNVQLSCYLNYFVNTKQIFYLSQSQLFFLCRALRCFPNLPYYSISLSVCFQNSLNMVKTLITLVFCPVESRNPTMKMPWALYIFLHSLRGGKLACCEEERQN